uniref:Ig-like domain-containing protein n=1 Tax=Esox lucius TaxID=8010 RepID=A0A3P8Y109_ESOLU
MVQRRPFWWKWTGGWCASGGAGVGSGGVEGQTMQTIEPNQHEVYVDEGSNVHLSCSYTSADSLLWYKQSPGSAPQYLMIILGPENVLRDDSLDSRFSGNQNKEKTRVDLYISSAEVTDSALYYCALSLLVFYVHLLVRMNSS